MANDTTSDTVTSKAAVRFQNKHHTVIREHARRSNFVPEELDVIVNVYFKLMNDLGPTANHILRVQLRSVLYQVFDMPDDFLIDRCMVALDNGLTPFVTLDTWITAMSLFLRGTRDERMRYCFAVYDIVGDGRIRRDQILQLLKKSVIKQQAEDVDETIKDMTDMLMKKMDHDLDGAISYEDYSESVRAQPPLLECFGQCMPDRWSVYAFLTTFTHRIKKF